MPVNGSFAKGSAQISYRTVSFDLSPDGAYLVFTGSGKGGSDLFLMNLKDYRVSRLTETDAYEIQPRFSPDGKMVVYSARNPAGDENAPWHLYLIEIDRPSPKRLTEGDCADSNPIWTPDGRRLVFSRSCRLRQRPYGDRAWYDPRVHLLDLSTQSVRSTPLVRVHSQNFSRAGEFLYVRAHLMGNTSDGSGLFLANLSAIDQEADTLKAQSRTVSLAPGGSESYFLADGEQIVFVGGNPSDKRYVREVWVGNLKSNLAQPITDIRSAFLWCLRADRAGEWVYFLWTDNPVTYRPKLWRVNTRTRQSEQVADSTLFDNPLEWKPSQ